ncbi:MAG: bifunctional folylpolyglutamate synthase/dihydrofolate synthase [Anaerolineaceae bacterium]|nr:bifunctional folylpolyglutamate synthase/dihydrofolate synthase [Anaerolineaceae bacterium]
MDFNQNDKAYQDTLDYLYSFVDYSLTRAFRYSADKFNLGRMVRFLDLIGNPHHDYPVIHIAGTKGKGSTAVFCAQALQQAGYKAGLYTSPHMEDYCERIQVNRTPITHQQLIELVNSVKDAVSKIPKLSTFEITTAIAFKYFSQQDTDIVVAEVGLGGRLDATNVVNPVVSAITSISLDHTSILGNTLSDIAREKSGIIKPGIPVVSAPQPAEALHTILDIAETRGSELTLVGRDLLWKPIEHSLEGQSAYIWYLDEQKGMDNYLKGRSKNVDWKPVILEIGMLGSHQMENAATAYAVLDVCQKAGFNIPREAVMQGFKSTKWPGRFEIIKEKPLVILDSAHNQDSARRLRQTLDDYLPDQTIDLIFGASEDKDVINILKELLPRIHRIYATKSEHPRALDPEVIVEFVNKMGRHAVAFNSVEETLKEVLGTSEPSNVILAAGSVFIAAAVRGSIVG